MNRISDDSRRPLHHMSNREIAAELAYWGDKWERDVFYLEHYLLLRAERAERIGMRAAKQTKQTSFNSILVRLGDKR